MTEKLYKMTGEGHIEFNEAEYAEYYARQAQVLAERPKLQALAEIERLEAEISPRRRDEAILQIDNGWLLNQRNLIAAQRELLRNPIPEIVVDETQTEQTQLQGENQD